MPDGPNKVPACRGKVRHATEADARKHLASMERRHALKRRDGSRVQIFECRSCGGFHIGSTYVG
jgi:hypothetical protein